MYEFIDGIEKDPKDKVIAVDFDGTLFKTQFPYIISPNMSIVKYIKSLQKQGAKIILNTCREGELLEAALIACKSVGLHVDYANENLPENIEKYGECRKIGAHMYIDDLAINVHELMYRIGDDENDGRWYEVV